VMLDGGMETPHPLCFGIVADPMLHSIIGYGTALFAFIIKANRIQVRRLHHRAINHLALQNACLLS